MPDTTFVPGTVITNRNRLWRVDAHEGDVLVATSIDGGQAEQCKFCVPFEDIRPGRLERPSPDIVGHPSAQDLLLRAYHLSLLHGTAPLISLQRSRVIPKDYQLVPVVMALETPACGFSSPTTWVRVFALYATRNTHHTSHSYASRFIHEH